MSLEHNLSNSAMTFFLECSYDFSQIVFIPHSHGRDVCVRPNWLLCSYPQVRSCIINSALPSSFMVIALKNYICVYVCVCTCAFLICVGAGTELRSSGLVTSALSSFVIFVHKFLS